MDSALISKLKVLLLLVLLLLQEACTRDEIQKPTIAEGTVQDQYGVSIQDVTISLKISTSGSLLKSVFVETEKVRTNIKGYFKIRFFIPKGYSGSYLDISYDATKYTHSRFFKDGQQLNPTLIPQTTNTFNIVLTKRP